LDHREGNDLKPDVSEEARSSPPRRKAPRQPRSTSARAKIGGG
jgi:hypothetical protein